MPRTLSPSVVIELRPLRSVAPEPSFRPFTSPATVADLFCVLPLIAVAFFVLVLGCVDVVRCLSAVPAVLLTSYPGRYRLLLPPKIAYLSSPPVSTVGVTYIFLYRLMNFDRPTTTSQQ